VGAAARLHTVLERTISRPLLRGVRGLEAFWQAVTVLALRSAGAGVVSADRHSYATARCASVGDPLEDRHEARRRVRAPREGFTACL